MIIDSTILDDLSAQAKENPRLRTNLDLRNSPNDNSQRMLNALEPGTQLPIHRHLESSETVVILRGAAIQYFYDEAGVIIDSVTIRAGSDCVGMSVEKGRWHRIESLESGTVILECKDGPYTPLREEEILEQ